MALNLVNVGLGAGFNFVVSCSMAQEPQQIDGVGHAAFVGDDLLGAQRDQRSVFSRKSQRFIKRVGVQRLATAQGLRPKPESRHEQYCFPAAAR